MRRRNFELEPEDEHNTSPTYDQLGREVVTGSLGNMDSLDLSQIAVSLGLGEGSELMQELDAAFGDPDTAMVSRRTKMDIIKASLEANVDLRTTILGVEVIITPVETAGESGPDSFVREPLNPIQPRDEATVKLNAGDR
jgi:hypothetical protein